MKGMPTMKFPTTYYFPEITIRIYTIGVVGPVVHIYVYIGLGAQSEDIK